MPIHLRWQNMFLCRVFSIFQQFYSIESQCVLCVIYDLYIFGIPQGWKYDRWTDETSRFSASWDKLQVFISEHITNIINFVVNPWFWTSIAYCEYGTCTLQIQRHLVFANLMIGYRQFDFVSQYGTHWLKELISINCELIRRKKCSILK